MIKKASHLHVTLFFNFRSQLYPTSKILVIGIWQPNRLFGHKMLLRASLLHLPHFWQWNIIKHITLARSTHSHSSVPSTEARMPYKAP
jgi:hypothetical protein